MSDQPCRACGCRFEFVTGPNGKPIPLQKVRSIYAVDRNVQSFGGDGQPRAVKVEVKVPDSAQLYVSHFETCSDPGRFSRK